MAKSYRNVTHEFVKITDTIRQSVVGWSHKVTVGQRQAALRVTKIAEGTMNESQGNDGCPELKPGREEAAFRQTELLDCLRIDVRSQFFIDYLKRFVK
jgi:hypothetical protein